MNWQEAKHLRQAIAWDQWQAWEFKTTSTYQFINLRMWWYSVWMTGIQHPTITT
jgi:hypothetical protein